MSTTMVSARGLLDALDDVTEKIIGPAAREVDESASFPRASLQQESRYGRSSCETPTATCIR
jgi:hypothetical protein